MNDYLTPSRRDVGAGLAAAGSTYVAAALLALFDLLSGSVSRGNPVVTVGMIVTPVLALTVATAVWRVTMPDEPNPRYGAVAGAFSGAVSVLVFAVLVAITAVLTGAAVPWIPVIVGFGLLYTLPVVVPIAALVGYGYERNLTGGRN